MNEKEIFEMTKHLDDKYVLEASSTAKRKINIKRRLVTFGVAAAIAASLSVGAVAAYKAFNKQSVSSYYDSSAVDKIENSGYAADQMTQNSHFRFTLDTVMKDDYNLFAVVTVSALDSKAEQFLTSNIAINSKATYADNGTVADTSAFLEYFDKYEKGKDIAMRLQIPVHSHKGDIDLSRALKLSFESLGTKDKVAESSELFKGLSLDISNVKTSKNAKFTSPSGKVLNVSEFSIATKSADEIKDPDKGLDADASKNAEKPTVKFKDGKTLTMKEDLNAVIVNLTKDNKTVTTYDLHTLIDPDNIESIEFCGETYTAK